jgi:hypothetical protein
VARVAWQGKAVVQLSVVSNTPDVEAIRCATLESERMLGLPAVVATVVFRINPGEGLGGEGFG